MKDEPKPVDSQANRARQKGVSRQAVHKEDRKNDRLEADNVFARAEKARARKWEAQADNEEARRDQTRGELVETRRVLEALEKAEAMKIARERSAFVVELPAKLGGQAADKIAAAYEAALNEIHAEFQKQFRTLAGI